MIFVLIFMNILYAKEGVLVPYKSPSLRLTLMADDSIRFIDPKIFNGRKQDSLLKIDTKKYRLYVGGDKTICKVDDNSPVVSTCVDKVRYIDWKVIGEDGQWKFMTDNDLCLTAGAYDNKTKGYFVNANTCNQDIPNQKFKFTEISKDDLSDDLKDPKNKKKSVQRMKSKEDPDLKIESSTEDNRETNGKDENAKKNIEDFQRDLATSDKEQDIFITLIDKDRPTQNINYKTNSTEMKKFLTGNNSKFINHDFIVDSGINANLLKA